MLKENGTNATERNSIMDQKKKEEKRYAPMEFNKRANNFIILGKLLKFH